ncbi:UNVERIFIED_CONTAM: hypothetical protein FKN15_026294 [Acipenser sinensis]
MDIVLTLKEKLSIRCIEHFALALEEQYNISRLYLLHDDECIEQSCSDVLHERFAMEMKCNVALRLAALHIQERIHTCGQPQKLSLKYIEKDWGIENFISSTLLRNMSVKDLKKAISFHMKQTQSLLEPRQKVFLDHNCDSAPYTEVVGKLQYSFEQQFSDFHRDTQKLMLFTDPFSTDPEAVESSIQLELIDLQCSDSIRCKYRKGHLLNFYNCLDSEKFQNLPQRAMKFACHFGSTFICEHAFSLLSLNKSKQRNRITDDKLEAVMYLATLKIISDILKLVSERQCNTSH